MSGDTIISFEEIFISLFNHILNISLSLVPPTFFNPESEVLDLIVGAELALNCTAAGNPTPVYNWQSSHPIKENMEDKAVLVSSSLLPGTYTCTASNTLEKRSKMFIVKTKNEGKIFK